MNVLTHEELLRVYKTFVIPLSQRPERSKRIKQHPVNSSINKCEDYEEEMQVEPLESTRCSSSMDIDFPHLSVYNGECMRNYYRMASPAGEKRRQRSSDTDETDIEARENDYQCQLSSVTKRIRINSLSS